ncbi:MAG: DUF971 domain-containing protein [Planctomycetota bacterium]
MPTDPPAHLDLKKDKGLTIQWSDGTGSYYTIPYLRRMSPSADQRELRRAMMQNPLTVIPGAPAGGEITATSAELVGNYAIKIAFSDGHSTGLYTWEYLREIDPANQPEDVPEGMERAPGDEGPAHDNPLGL